MVVCVCQRCLLYGLWANGGMSYVWWKYGAHSYSDVYVNMNGTDNIRIVMHMLTGTELVMGMGECSSSC